MYVHVHVCTSTDLCDTDLYSLVVGGPEYVPTELCYKRERGEGMRE